MSIAATPDSTKPTVALFGATGGCVHSVLEHALTAGYVVNCLARTPSKLSALSTQYPEQLHVIQGDITSVASIKQTLRNPHTNTAVDIIISGIGMVLQRKGLGFTSAQPHICDEGTRNILTALSELEGENTNRGKKWREPLMVLLSTTGISSLGRDIPLAMIPLYHWMLSVPHVDKKAMKETIAGSGRQRWVCVRPCGLAWRCRERKNRRRTR